MHNPLHPFVISILVFIMLSERELTDLIDVYNCKQDILKRAEIEIGTPWSLFDEDGPFPNAQVAKVVSGNRYPLEDEEKIFICYLCHVPLISRAVKGHQVSCSRNHLEMEKQKAEKAVKEKKEKPLAEIVVETKRRHKKVEIKKISPEEIELSEESEASEEVKPSTSRVPIPLATRQYQKHNKLRSAIAFGQPPITASTSIEEQNSSQEERVQTPLRRTKTGQKAKKEAKPTSPYYTMGFPQMSPTGGYVPVVRMGGREGESVNHSPDPRYNMIYGYGGNQGYPGSGPGGNYGNFSPLQHMPMYTNERGEVYSYTPMPFSEYPSSYGYSMNMAGNDNYMSPRGYHPYPPNTMPLNRNQMLRHTMPMSPHYVQGYSPRGNMVPMNPPVMQGRGSHLSHSAGNHTVNSAAYLAHYHRNNGNQTHK